MIVDELIAILGYETQNEGELRRFQQSLDRTTQRVSALGVAAGTFIGTIAAQAFGRLADAVGSLPGDVISVSAQFESLEASLTTVTGGVEQARSSMDWIKQFARDTPYEVGSITDAFIKLKSYGIDPLADDALKTLGDTASAMNKPLNQAVEALADATSFEFERLKEFGLRAQQQGDQVTFSWTENGKQLSKTIKKNSEEVRKFVLDQLGGRFNGAMVRQSKTWNGMMSNLGDAWTAFLLKIGEGGFFDAVKGKLGQLMDYFNRLASNGTLDRWSKALSTGFTAVADGIASFAVRIGRHFETIAGIIDRNKGAFDVLKWALAGLAVYLFPTAALFAALAAALDDFLTYLRGGDSVIGDFVKALSSLTGADTDAVEAALTGIAVAAGGLAAAGIAVGGFTASLWPLAAALAAVGGGYMLAKAFFDNIDAEAAKVKAAENPRTKPGYVENANTGSAAESSNNPDGYLKPSDFAPGFEEEKQRLIEEEARRVGADKPAKRKLSAYDRLGGDYVRSDVSGDTARPDASKAADLRSISDMVRNAQANFARMDAPKASEAVNSTVNNTLNDSSDKSTTVNVGGVTVNGVQNASGAVGAAVGQAVGNSAAKSAKRSTWWEQGEKF